MRKVYIIYSAFVYWVDVSKRRKILFDINFHKQSQNWSKGSVRIETLLACAQDLRKHDHMLSFDIKAEYLLFRLAPSMRNMFFFHYKKILPFHGSCFRVEEIATLVHEVHGYPASVLTECPTVPRLGIFG